MGELIDLVKQIISEYKGCKAQLYGRLNVPLTSHPAWDVETLLKNKYYADIRIPDSELYFTNYDKIIDIIREDLVDTRTWILNKFDCNSFSGVFAALCKLKYYLHVGNVWSWTSMHAFNLIITDEKDLYILEPQTDQIWEADNLPDVYKPYYVIDSHATIWFT